MRSHAARTHEKSSRRDKRKNAARPQSAGPDQDLTDQETLLDHLDAPPAPTLADTWAQATRDSAMDLPYRAELEARFEQDLGHLQAFAGAGVRSLLDSLGAEAATRGDQILLPGPDVSIETVAHEVAHALQGGSTVANEWPGVLAEDHEAETHADAAAQAVSEGDQVSPDHLSSGSMRRGFVALRRTGAAPVRPGSALGSPRAATGVDVDDAPAEADDAPGRRRAPRRRSPAEPRAPPEDPAPRARTAARAPAPSPPPAEATPDAAQPVEEPAGVAPADEAARDVEPEAEAEAGPDRQQQIRDELTAGQQTWDSTSTEADEHEVNVCPCSGVEAGEHPFARGPPLEVPPVSEDAPGGPVEPAEVDTDTMVSEASRAAARQVARAPGSAGNGDLGSDAAAFERQIDGEDAPEIPDTPELSLTEEADPAQITDRHRTLTGEVETCSATARTQSEEDFGEHELAPAEDPTLGHDASLDALEIPSVTLEDHVSGDALDRVVTDANAGTLTLDEALVVRDEEMAQYQEAIDQQSEAQAEIDRHIATTESSIDRACSRACSEQTTRMSNAEREVEKTRGEWRDEANEHVGTRRREAQTLVDDNNAHIERVETETNRDAAACMTAGKTEAEAAWSDGQERAENKLTEDQDRNILEQALDWLLDQIRDWITDFFSALREAVNGLLDAFSDAAHAVVDAGHAAITATIEVTRDGLDFIADNLPGELGDIAREHRDDIHAFLDDVQAGADETANALHATIDENVEAAREGFNSTLDDLEQGLLDAVDDLEDFLDNPIATILRQFSPELADLAEEGLDGLAQRAADQINSWLQSAVDATGIGRLTQWLQSLHDQNVCSEQAFAEAEQRSCEALESLLQQALGWFDGLLASPAAQSVQETLQAQQDQAAEEQVDAVTDFLDFLHEFAAPIYEVWQVIETAAGSVIEALGDIGQTVWRHVAEALGIDPNIGPLEALRRGIQHVWDGIVSFVQPLIDGLLSAWNWVREHTPIGAIIDFFASLPEAWNALTDFVGRVAGGVAEAISTAAEVFSSTVIGLLQTALQAVSGVLHSAIGVASQFVDGIFGLLDAILGWQSGLALLDALASVVQTLFAPIVAGFRLLADCAIFFWRTIADGVGNILHWLRILADICVGIVTAMIAPPISIAAFFAGAVWLYLIPPCFKPPIINFLLDVCIRIIRFFPEPADFLMAAIYNGAVGFLEALREAPDEQKVRAVDLIASLFAGNVELAAGFAVGLVKGVWESTGGTIIFLVQAVAWLVMLPVRLVQWATGLADGTTEEDGVTPSEGGEEGSDSAGAGSEEGAAEEEVTDEETGSLRRARDPPGHRAPEERPAGEPAREEDSIPSEGASGSRLSRAGGAGEGPESTGPLSATAEAAARSRAEPEDPAARAEEAEGALGPDTDEEEDSEQEDDDEAEDIDEAEAGVEEGGELGGDEEPPARSRAPRIRTLPDTASPSPAGARGGAVSARLTRGATSPGARVAPPTPSAAPSRTCPPKRTPPPPKTPALLKRKEPTATQRTTPSPRETRTPAPRPPTPPKAKAQEKRPPPPPTCHPSVISSTSSPPRASVARTSASSSTASAPRRGPLSAPSPSRPRRRCWRPSRPTAPPTRSARPSARSPAWSSWRRCSPSSPAAAAPPSPPRKASCRASAASPASPASSAACAAPFSPSSTWSSGSAALPRACSPGSWAGSTTWFSGCSAPCAASSEGAPARHALPAFQEGPAPPGAQGHPHVGGPPHVADPPHAVEAPHVDEGAALRAGVDVAGAGDAEEEEAVVAGEAGAEEEAAGAVEAGEGVAVAEGEAVAVVAAGAGAEEVELRVASDWQQRQPGAP
ncbi:MAG: DUF4157 domain-containing protein [Polyangiaceae bacterium]